MADVFARIMELGLKVQSAASDFRAFHEPGDLSEFEAFYDEAEQRAVIAKAHDVVNRMREVHAESQATVDAQKFFVATVVFNGKKLVTNLAAADSKFDAASMESVLAVPQAVQKPAVSADVRKEVVALFAPLARSKAEKALVETIAAAATGFSKKGKDTQVRFGRAVLTVAPSKKKVGANVPASYGALAKSFGSLTWNAGAGTMGFLGLDAKGAFNEGGWEVEALEEGDNEAFVKALAKKKLKPKDVHCAFGVGSNWVLYDPTREAKSGEPAFGFVSHGDCEWVSLKGLDGTDATGVLLQLMAWSLAGKPAIKDVYA